MRTAIFGGTFDPIHSTHLAMARAAADQLALDEVLFIPTGNPPHKATGTPYEHRFRMVELACAADPRFVASRIEEGNAKSYSIHTIERLKALKPDANPLFFVIGADAFEEIRTWHRWQEVIAAVEFIVIGRPGHTVPTVPGARTHKVEMAESDVSSSEIRRELAKGIVPPALPNAVAEYIREKNLYK
jgi:nicotinate-nucleotide adenylyltransferase